jgi:hypothetical protein
MNYIKRLEEENKEMASVLAEIESYLYTDKFRWPNDYVNVNDILNMIQPIRCLFRSNGDE